MAQIPRLTKLDYLQVRMFQLLYKLRLPNMGTDVAFSTAIEDTSNVNMQEALRNRPHLVEEWIAKFSRKHFNRRNRNEN